MIVLRIHSHGRQRDVRLEKPRVVVGSAPEADVVENDVGWADQEVELVHRGTEVELRRIHRTGDLRMRVGDEVRLGHARLALVGLLPLAEDGAPPPPATGDPPTPPSRPLELELEPATPDPVAPPPPLYGDYEEKLPRADEAREEPAAASGSGTFELVNELRPAPPPDLTPPAPRPRKGAPPPRPRSGKQEDARAEETAKPAKEPDRRAAAAAVAAAAAKPSTKGQPPLPRPPTPAFGHATFGEEIVRQLKRAPFFFLSLGLHVLAFLVLSVLQLGADVGGPEGEYGTIHAAFDDPADEEKVSLDEAGDPEDPIPLLPELPTPSPVDEEPRVDEPPAEGDTLDARPTEEPAPLIVGISPSLASVDAGTGTSKQMLRPSELKQEFSKREATSANERAAEFVRGRLGNGTGRRGHLLDTLVKPDLLVVDGSFDKIHKVLYALRLPYVRVPPSSVAMKSAPPLSQHKVIFWNCSYALPDHQKKQVALRLNRFVKKGGFLFTTDWCVKNVLGLAFEGYLDSTGERGALQEEIIAIRPVTGQERHPLLEGVFLPGIQGQWWLERSSFDVIVQNTRHVTPLITSEDLLHEGRRSGVVAATFPYGRGQVLHVMGHYYQEAGNLAGTISAQRLALNFVLMRLERD